MVCGAVVGDFDGLGNALVALLALQGRVADGEVDYVILLSGNNQQRPALRVLTVYLRFRRRIEVGGGGPDELNRPSQIFLVELECRTGEADQ
jgi:hypothetical protein